MTMMMILLGDYYLRLLLEEDETNEEYSAIKKSSVSVTFIPVTLYLFNLIFYGSNSNMYCHISVVPPYAVYTTDPVLPYTAAPTFLPLYLKPSCPHYFLQVFFPGTTGSPCVGSGAVRIVPTPFPGQRS